MGKMFLIDNDSPKVKTNSYCVGGRHNSSYKSDADIKDFGGKICSWYLY